MSLVASAVTTTFVPPADQLSVVGYYPSGVSEVGTIVCGSEYEFLVSSTYGICCQTASQGNCGFKQSCYKSMMVYEDGTSYTCANDNPCISTTIYQMSPSQGWSATMAWCMDADNPTDIYRSFVGTKLTLVTVDTITTTTSTDPTVTSPSRNIPSITSTTETATTTTGLPSATGIGANDTIATSQPSEAHHSSGTNVGAIAGGVVGGVAGLALIIAAIWYVLRRQKQKNTELREIGAGYVAPERK